MDQELTQSEHDQQLDRLFVCREELCRHALGRVPRTADYQDDAENARNGPGPKNQKPVELEDALNSLREKSPR